MSRPVRILHVSQPTDYGVGRYVAALADAQAAAGWDVVVASPTDGALATSVTAVGARHVAWAASRSPGPAMPAETATLRHVVDTTRPDVVHLHSSKAGLAGRAAIRAGRPTIFQPHAWSFLAGPPPLRLAARRWERWAARWCDAIICGSHAEQQRGARARITSRWHVVPNAIDVRRFPAAGPGARDEARRRLAIGDGPVAVCVGRLCHQKGQDVLLDAWPAVRRAVPDARLLLVGDGPDRARIEQRATAGVELHGQQDDVAPWLRAADVVVQPSRYETMALSMLEAMATGRSVVATDVEGAHEALHGGETPAGAVVAPGDRHALAAHLVRRLADPQLAAREGRAGRRRVEARHDVAAAAGDVEAIVADVLARRAPHHPFEPTKRGTRWTWPNTSA